MGAQIEDLDVVCSDNGIRGAPEDLEIFGTPFHEPKDVILKKYVNNDDAEFLRYEQLKSCGNYLLFDGRDPESVRIITSPGYASGYAYSGSSFVRVSGLLTHAVQSWHSHNGAIDMDYLKFFLNKQRPFQGTPFENISQVRPGTSYYIDSGTITSASSYLTSRDGSATSIEQAMRECAAALSGADVTVMFSGGLDSLSWYLILRSELGDDNVNLVTVDWRPESRAQGPYLARPVADKLSVNLDVVSYSDGWLTDDMMVVDHITSWMEKDITIARNPSHALINSDGLSDVVLNLTNNESLLALQMNHFYLKKYINENNSIRRNIDMVGFIISMQYIHNIQYTSSYMRSYVLRFVFLALVWPSVKLTDTFHPVGVDMDLAKASWDDIDLSESAILESIVEKTAPNIKFEQFSELVNRELNGILGLIGQRDIHHLARILYYYAHMSWASNVLEKLPLTTQQSRTYLPTTWGPMISSSLFEDLTLNDVFYPRQELLTIVESETGLPFEKLRPLSEEKSTDNPRISTSKYKENVYSSILVEHDHLLSIDQSILLQRMSGDNSRWYERELENVTGLIENGQGSFSSVTKASRVVNLELLLRNSI